MNLQPQNPAAGGRRSAATAGRCLFRCDQPTRMDFAVHLGLGLAAVMAVVFSLVATFDFCARFDQIVERFSEDRSSAAVSAPAEKEKTTFTNAARVGAPLVDPGQVPRTNLPSAVPAVSRENGSPMSG